jgi:hypothetical protein
MIEQTPLVVNKWHYFEPTDTAGEDLVFLRSLTFDVQKKRNSQKKGIAFRYTFEFSHENKTVLHYVAEDSYVIDFDDVIDRHELMNMIRNSFEKFKEQFDYRKLGTPLQNRSMSPLDETSIDLDMILPLLI